MDAEIINAIKDLGGLAWMGAITWMVLRWRFKEAKAVKSEKYANGNGLNRRLTDKVPGNPGHSLFEVLDSKLDELDYNHTAFKKEAREDIKKLFKCVSHIEGVLEIRPPE
jgi:hypothetical protein